MTTHRGPSFCEKKKTTKKPTLTIFLACLFAIILDQGHAATYKVYADDEDTSSISSSESGSYDLAEAMALARAGDTVSLGDGTYRRALVTKADGEEGNPITIVGGENAVINGDYSSRSVLVQHSYITLKGFTVDGKVGSADEAESYVYKCIYVKAIETDADAPLVGFVMEGLTIKNCGGECVRLKDYVTGAKITGNTIQDCGIHDYRFDWGSKNGEGIYIGTSNKQWKDGETGCHDNLVRGNRIKTNGNECVDIKEGSTGNLVDSNLCSAQLDANSGCFNARGDDNTFCYNIGENCQGAGVRLGGADVDGYQYGVRNNVYGNDFNHIGYGAIKVNAIDQGDVCGNTCEDGDCEISGEHASGVISETWNQTCFDLAHQGSSTASSTRSILSQNDTSSSSSPSIRSSFSPSSIRSSSSSPSSFSSSSYSGSPRTANLVASSNSASSSSGITGNSSSSSAEGSSSSSGTSVNVTSSVEESSSSSLPTETATTTDSSTSGSEEDGSTSGGDDGTDTSAQTSSSSTSSTSGQSSSSSTSSSGPEESATSSSSSLSAASSSADGDDTITNTTLQSSSSSLSASPDQSEGSTSLASATASSNADESSEDQKDSDDYGNDYGDDYYSEDEEDGRDGGKDKGSDSDDYGNDHGDDFYSDDDGSADRGMPFKNSLRGGKL